MTSVIQKKWRVADQPTSQLELKPFAPEPTFKERAYDTLKQAIINMDIYGKSEETWLDERQLSDQLAVSRTPIREAIAMLEQQGFVKTVPRRGIIVLRKTKREVIEMIQAWAALEGMAARLVVQTCDDASISELRKLFNSFHDAHKPADHLSEYSTANIQFHQMIITMSGSNILRDMTANILLHVRGIRQLTIGRDSRVEQSIKDHLAIIEAFEQRDVERAERLCRDHTLGLADYVEKHGDGLFA